MQLAQWNTGIRCAVGMLMSLSASAALACTTMALGLPQKPVIAYSFDYAAADAGFLFVNPASATRSSIMDDTPAQWTVRHGSVTFNQMGPGMPAAGMNTAGLVVSLMWNDDAVFAGDEDAPVVTELEFIQRLLDTSASVDEAMNALHGVRIQGFVPIHFFVADRTGNAAIITPTRAGPTIHELQDMPVPALTNTSYAELKQRLADFAGFGGEQDMPESDGDPSSLKRFLIAADAIGQAGASVTPDEAFSALARVANRSSRWQVVFDPTEGRVAFRIVGSTGTFRVDLSTIDFECRERPLALALSGVSGADLPASLATVDPAAVSAATRQILASLPRAAGLSPDMADGLTAGLLAAVSCKS